MNKEFMIKMMQAKKLEYEALKEVLPVPVVNRISSLEKELMDLGKEYFMTVVCSEKKESPAAEPEAKSKARKVTIE